MIFFIQLLGAVLPLPVENTGFYSVIKLVDRSGAETPVTRFSPSFLPESHLSDTFVAEQRSH